MRKQEQVSQLIKNTKEEISAAETIKELENDMVDLMRSEVAPVEIAPVEIALE
jgi:hypothetical protein